MAQLKNTVVNGSLRVNGFMSVGGDLTVNNFHANKISTNTISSGDGSNYIVYTNDACKFGSSDKSYKIFSKDKPTWWKDGENQGELALKSDIKDTWRPVWVNDTEFLKNIPLTCLNIKSGTGIELDTNTTTGALTIKSTVVGDTYKLENTFDKISNKVTTKLINSKNTSSDISWLFTGSLSATEVNKTIVITGINSWRTIAGATSTDSLALGTGLKGESRSGVFTISPDTKILATNESVKTQIKNVTLQSTGDKDTPVYINRDGKPETTRSFKGLVEASVNNNILTLKVL